MRRNGGQAVWLLITRTEQTLQQPRTIELRGVIEKAQRLALQAAVLTQQQRYFAGLANAPIQLLGKGLERTTDLAGQGQALQLPDQLGQRRADLIDAGLAPLLGVEHGFFQARQQGGQACIHVVGADDFAHFLHALVNRAVCAFCRQRAAHQATTQQVEAGIPTTFEFFLLFDAFEVLLFPAVGFVAHSGVPRGAGLNAGNASAVSEPGRRISTATGR